jgi:hypothetical protein
VISAIRKAIASEITALAVDSRYHIDHGEAIQCFKDARMTLYLLQIESVIDL